MPQVKFTKEEVEKVSKLAKLKLSDEEVTLLADRLTDTLKYMNVINELDTSSTEETFQVTGLKNIYQATDNSQTLPAEKALANAAKKDKGLFVTKGVFERS